MQYDRYPFIDLAVHPSVRERFASGDALAIATPDLATILWANGPAAELLGFRGIYDLIEDGIDGQPALRRQLAAAIAALARKPNQMVMIRVAGGFRRGIVAAEVQNITLPGGRAAVLISSEGLHPARDESDRARQIISGFDGTDTHVAVLDGAGKVLAGSPSFETAGLAADELARMVRDVAREEDRLVKRMTRGARGSMPTAIARLTDDPALHLVFAVEPMTGEASGTTAVPPADRVPPEPAEPQPVFDTGKVRDELGAHRIEPDESAVPPSFAEARQIDGIEAEPDERAEDDPLWTAIPPQDTLSGPDENPARQDAADGQEDDARHAPGGASTEQPEPADGPTQPQDSAADQTDDFVFDPTARPVRFVWKIDRHGQFSDVSPEFAAAVGPNAADIVGRSFPEVATVFNLDPNHVIADLLSRRDTWSGKTVNWPVQGTDLIVPVDLAALPTYTRERRFDGFRGFGIVRVGEARSDRDAIGLALVPGPWNGPIRVEDEEEAEWPAAEEAGESGAAEIADAAEIGTIVETDSTEPLKVDDEQVSGDGLGDDTVPLTAGYGDIAHDADGSADDAAFAEPTEAADDEPDPFHGERPALAFSPTAGRRETDKIIDLETRRARARETLTPLEQAAFLEIGKKLGLSLGEDEPTEPTAEGEAGEKAEPGEEATTGADESSSDQVEDQQPEITDTEEDGSPTAESDDAAAAEEETARPHPSESARRPAAEQMDEDHATLFEGVGEDVSASLSQDDEPDESDETDGASHDIEAADGLPIAKESAETAWDDEETAPAEAADTADPWAGDIVPEAGEDELDEGDAEAPEAAEADPGVEDDAEDEPVAEDRSASVAQPDHPAHSEASERSDEIRDQAATEPDSDETGEAAGEEHPPASAASLPYARVLNLPSTFPLPPRQSSRTALTEAAVDLIPAALLVHTGDRLIHANPEFLALTGYDTLGGLKARGGIDSLIEEAGSEGDEDDGRPGHVTLRRADGSRIAVGAKLRSINWYDTQALLLAFYPLPGAEGGRWVPANDASGGMAAVEAETRAGLADLPESVGPGGDREAEMAALAVEANELRSILETATDGVVIIGEDNRIRSMNGSARALFGFEEAETKHQPFAMLFAHESQRAVMDYLAGLAEHGVSSVLNDGREVIGREANGGLVPLFMTIGRLSGSNGYCAVLRDITQWKRSEEELREAKRAAETANSHKSDFLARVSHEIRTPLNAIIGFSEMMMEERFGPIGSPRYLEYAHDIGSSGKHVLDIVNDLLDISKIEAGQVEFEFDAVSLNDQLAECVSMLQPIANSQRVIIRTSLSAKVPEVVADSRSIKQIALNLLSNSVRYTPAGGQIVVSTAYEANGSVVLRIRDTGIGMSRKELEHAMRPFGQVGSAARKRGDGTGLGLPLTKAMVEANRAQFDIVSAPKEGTLVTITFPPQRVLTS